MQFIKSLFCWHGFDNRPRFILINISCFIAFILFNQSLSDFRLSAIFSLLLCCAICLAATRRRLNDAQLNKNWTLAPAGSFVVVGLMIIFIGHSISYYLLLIPLLLAMTLLTYPSKGQKRFILGYNGPVSLAGFQQVKKANTRNSQRVEPTINTINVNQPDAIEHDHSSPANNAHSTVTDAYHANNHSQGPADIGETIRLMLLGPNNVRFAIMGASILILVVLLLTLISSSPEPSEQPLTQTSKPEAATSKFQHQLALPDNFSLMFSSDNALVIHWQANVEDNREVWALASAKGDKNCENITFNKADTIRTYRVNVLDNSYYAYFSPLDTKALIKNIAFKNDFSLCGYNFSLKGSQATLGKSNFYANLIEY